MKAALRITTAEKNKSGVPAIEMSRFEIAIIPLHKWNKLHKSFVLLSARQIVHKFINII